MAYRRINVVVTRESNKEPVFLISALRSDTLSSADQLLAALTAAITRWMAETPEGKKAWVYAGEKFNIGDLDLYFAELIRHDYLADEGIVDLQLLTPDLASSWVWNTPLTGYEGD